MNEPHVIRHRVHLRQIGRKEGDPMNGQGPSPTAGRVPRVARLLALAIHIDELIQRGEAASYAQLARRAHVSRGSHCRER